VKTVLEIILLWIAANLFVVGLWNLICPPSDDEDPE